MAQEVQTDLNYRAELNLIEGVGHQENRVKEHSQIEQAFGYECEVYGEVSCYNMSGQPPEEEKGTLSIISMRGNTEFKLVNGGLRIPLSGPYLAEISTKGGVNLAHITTNLKLDGKIIYTSETSSGNRVTVQMVLNLGRYSIIEDRASIYNTGSGGIRDTAYLNLKLKKL